MFFRRPDKGFLILFPKRLESFYVGLYHFDEISECLQGYGVGKNSFTFVSVTIKRF